MVIAYTRASPYSAVLFLTAETRARLSPFRGALFKHNACVNSAKVIEKISTMYFGQSHDLRSKSAPLKGLSSIMQSISYQEYGHKWPLHIPAAGPLALHYFLTAE